MAPSAPPMEYRFFGRMATPAGEHVILLTRGEAVAAIEVGTRFDNGYIVEAIHDDRVRTVYAPTGIAVDIPVPPPPESTR